MLALICLQVDTFLMATKNPFNNYPTEIAGQYSLDFELGDTSLVRQLLLDLIDFIGNPVDADKSLELIAVEWDSLSNYVNRLQSYLELIRRTRTELIIAVQARDSLPIYINSDLEFPESAEPVEEEYIRLMSELLIELGEKCNSLQKLVTDIAENLEDIDEVFNALDEIATKHYRTVKGNTQING
jgi:hypothetical protein